MTYDILKIAFYVLMCIPIFIIGLVFFLRLKSNRKELIEAEIREKEERAIAKEKAKLDAIRRQSFYDDYDKNKGYK